ncbi:MAG TPA: 4-hydroxy-tetrahydrodipicolinate reductase, partial [Phycisphaerae bacterium]
EQARIEEAAGAIAILKAANFSVGINVLLSLVGRLAAELGDDYDIEIVEAHHRAKVDAPSGTALWLLQAITEATGRDPHTDVVHGRSGAIGPRPPRQIGVHALRLGDNPGCHTIHFATAGERLSLTHAATSRDTFARGALRAAEWVARRRPGMYTMADCLDAR